MTIEQYLQGSVDFNLTDTNVATIVFRRRIPEGANIEDVSEKDRDLALADLYMFIAYSSTSSSGDYESDGGWQRQRSSKNAYNRSGLQAMAKALYEKWGEIPITAEISGKVKLKSLY